MYRKNGSEGINYNEVYARRLLNGHDEPIIVIRCDLTKVAIVTQRIPR